MEALQFFEGIAPYLTHPLVLIGFVMLLFFWILLMQGSSSSRGGVRPGVGRPKGSGKYGDVPTQVVRIPVDRFPQIQRWLEGGTVQLGTHSSCRRQGEVDGLFFPPDLGEASVPKQALPLYPTRITAGFPSPADDYVEGTLDLNEHFMAHPAATFFVRVAGDSMIGAGIHPGDILVVDRSLDHQSGQVVIAVVDGELTVKRLKIDGAAVFLLAGNEGYAPIRITDAMDFHVWGVVAHVIHSL